MKGYDGVKYQSTQFIQQESLKLPLFNSSLIQENLCLFAKYSSKTLYDTDLLNRFDIEILSNNNIKDYQENDILKLCNQLLINSFLKFQNINIFLQVANRIENTIKCKNFIDNKNKGFYNSYIDKVELHAQSIYLYKLMRQFNEINIYNVK